MIKPCPKCRGQMLLELDVDGKYIDHCLQCGYSPDSSGALMPWVAPNKEAGRMKKRQSLLIKNGRPGEKKEDET